MRNIGFIPPTNNDDPKLYKGRVCSSQLSVCKSLAVCTTSLRGKVMSGTLPPRTMTGVTTVNTTALATLLIRQRPMLCDNGYITDLLGHYSYYYSLKHIILYSGLTGPRTIYNVFLGIIIRYSVREDL